MRDRDPEQHRDDPRRHTAAPGLPSAAILALQRSAGNAAVASVLARAKNTVPPNERTAMIALEAQMKAAQTQTMARHEALCDLSATGSKVVKKTKDHLRGAAGNFAKGYGEFEAVTRAADANYELEEELWDIVQGVAIAAALAVVGPEMVLAHLGLEALTAAAVKEGALLNEVGFTMLSAATGEAGEVAAGKIVDPVDADDRKPSTTASEAGPSPGERYEQAFEELSRLIDLQPQFHEQLSVAFACAMAASDVENQAGRLAEGSPSATVGVPQAAIMGSVVWGLNEAGRSHLTAAKQATAKLERAAEAIMREIDLKDPDTVQDDLWTNWMARCASAALLDADPIQKHLTERGLLDLGEHDRLDPTDSADAHRAITAARSSC